MDLIAPDAVQASAHRQASLVWSPHPLLAGEGRVIAFDPPTGAETLHAYLTRLGVDLSGPVIVAVDRAVIPREWLARVRPKPGTLISVRAAVAGGDGSQVVAIVAMIAISIAAPYLAGAAYGLATSGTALTMAQASVWAANTMVGMAMTAGITVAGSMAISALTPKPKIDLGRAMSSAKESPTYSLSGGSNQARPYEPLGLTLGRHRIFFDLASRPYGVYEGADQYLYQVFHVGMHGANGPLRVEDLRIGTTPLTDYQGVTTEFSSDVMPSLMPYNVDTIAGAAVSVAGGAVQRTSSADTTRLEVDMQFVLFYSGNGGLESRTVAFRLEYRAVGAVNWLPMGFADVPDFYTNYWSYGYIGSSDGRPSFFDGLPVINGDGQPVYEGVGDSIWIQTSYDANHDPAAHTDGVGGWKWRAYADKPASDPAPPSAKNVLSANLTYSGSSATPLRQTYGVDVAQGIYEIRCSRVTPDETDSRATSDINLVALKCYQSQPGDFLGQDFLAVKVKASGQLNGTLSTLSGIVSQPVAVNTYSSNPADLFLLFARGYRVAGRLLWGAGMADADIDLPAIEAWRVWCASKTLSCNMQVDSAKSVWDILQAICRCGRASPSWSTGKLGVLWDAGDMPIVAVFGPSNIKRGSFEVAYGSEAVCDEVTLSFVDADADYKADTIRVAAPGVTTPVKPASIELWGCTNRDQAIRECRLQVAHQIYRTRQVTWVTDMEGLVVTRGDVVALSHDLTQWGTSGRLIGGSSTVLYLDRTITLDAGGNWITVVEPNGTMHTCRVQYVAGDVATVTLLDALPSAPDDDNPIDWRWLADYQATPGKRVKITDIKPTSMHEVRITAMDDPDEYYAFEGGTYAPLPVQKWTSSDPQISMLTAKEERLLVGASSTLTLIVNWIETGNVAHRRVSYSVANGPWQEISGVSGPSVRINIPDAGTVLLSVDLFNAAGQVGDLANATLSHAIQGIGSPSSAPIGVVLAEPFVGPDCSIKWDAHRDAGSYIVEVWSGSVKRRTVRDIAAPSYTYTFSSSRADGGPFRTLEFRVFVVSESGIAGAYSALTAANPQVAAPSGLQIIGAGKSISVSASKRNDIDYAGTRIWMSQTSGFNPLATSPVYDGIDTSFSALALAEGQWYVRVAHYDQFGTDGLVISSEFAVTVTSLGGVRAVTALPANPSAVSGDLAVFLDTATASQRGIWGWDGSAWKNTRDGANLVAASVAADRLAVSQLSAITANLGAMTSGSITLDAAGFIRGGSTGYMTGAGIWMGYHSGLYKVHVGNPTGAGFSWDGSIFTIRGSDGSVLLASGSGVPYAKVSGVPTSLSGINSGEATKLAGIQAGATVGADASNLNVGMGGNLLSNTEFGGGIVAPVFFGWNPGGCTFTPLRVDDTWRPASAQCLEIQQGARSGNQWNLGADVYVNGLYGYRASGIPVIPGKRYEFSGKLAAHRADSGLWVDFFDANDVVVAGGTGTGWVTRSSGGRDLSVWTHAAIFAVAPAGAVYASAYWRKSDTDAGQATSFAWLCQPYFGEATAAQTVPSTYTPGVGRGALANVSKITQGNASTFIDNAAIGSAQIGSVALVGVGNFSVKSATAGARMEMDSQVIKVFDASGALRIKLGNLAA